MGARLRPDQETPAPPAHAAQLHAGPWPRPGLQQLEWRLQGRLAAAAMRLADVCVVKDCLRELEAAVAQLGPHWRVQPFGGVANGFAMRGSDLDATCFVDGMQASDVPMATQELQTRLLPLLRAHGRFEIIDQIWTARVPILKLRFDTALEVDLSCHNTEALPNTQLLRAYAELHPQVRNLGVSVKLWAKAEGICGAAQGHLSSYALTLMAVYFLQVDPMVQMPCLPTWMFDGSSTTPAAARVSWACRLPTTVLLARFFRFYVAEFQWCTEVVSVRNGRRAAATDPAYERLGAGFSPRLHIEDPFLVGRNLHCVLGLEQECVLYVKLREAAHTMQRCELPAVPGPPPAAEPAGAAPDEPLDGRHQPPRSGAPQDKSADAEGEGAGALSGSDGGSTKDTNAGSSPAASEPGTAKTSSDLGAPTCPSDSGGEPAKSEAERQERPAEAAAEDGEGGSAEAPEAQEEEQAEATGGAAVEGPPPDEVPTTLLQGYWKL